MVGISGDVFGVGVYHCFTRRRYRTVSAVDWFRVVGVNGEERYISNREAMMRNWMTKGKDTKDNWKRMKSQRGKSREMKGKKRCKRVNERIRNENSLHIGDRRRDVEEMSDERCSYQWFSSESVKSHEKIMAFLFFQHHGTSKKSGTKQQDWAPHRYGGR